MSKIIRNHSINWVLSLSLLCFSSISYSLDEDELGCIVGNCVDGRGTLVTEGDRGVERYSGNFAQGKYHGYGSVSYEDEGINYKGQWVLGKKQGRGTLWDKENNVYIGLWKNNRRNGEGIQVYKAENWKEGEHGESWLKNNTENYFGDFKNDVYYGQGTYRWADGTKYVGSWVASKKHGDGHFDYGNGIISKRKFEFDVKVFE